MFNIKALEEHLEQQVRHNVVANERILFALAFINHMSGITYIELAYHLGQSIDDVVAMCATLQEAKLSSTEGEVSAESTIEISSKGKEFLSKLFHNQMEIEGSNKNEVTTLEGKTAPPADTADDAPSRHRPTRESTQKGTTERRSVDEEGSQDSPLLCYFEGKIIPLSEAKIHILTNAFSYGTGCFEGIRAYYNEDHGQLYVFRGLEHYQRLQDSAHILLMDLPMAPEILVDRTIELLSKSGLYTDSYIRPMMYKADEIIGVRLHDLRSELYITVQPFGNYIDIHRALNVGTSTWRRIDDNMIPARGKVSGAYVNSAFAKTEAQLNGFDEAIMLDHDGHVSEGSAENLFMLRGGTVYTPPVTANILEGITRNTVMTLLREEMGLTVVEREIDRTELYVCDELILCGTGAQIAPVGTIDHRKIGDGSVGQLGRALQDLYFEVVRNNVPKYSHWCTPVHQRRRQSRKRWEQITTAS